MWLIAPIALAALAQGWLLTLAARRAAPVLGLVDCPDSDRKRHLAPTPLLGGVAVYATFVLATLQYYAMRWMLEGGDPLGGRWTLAILASGGLFCALGLWDDKWGTSPRTKLLGQVLASLPFVLWGRQVAALDVLGVQLALGGAGPLLVVLWLVVCSNVINLLDGLDGVAASVGLVVCATMAAVALTGGNAGVFAVAVLLSASLAGFLFHNWPPARVFLGDSGSLTIGFFLGALAIEGAVKSAAGFSLVLPLVLLSVPGFDTLMAIVRRVLTGRRIGQGDRSHLHHCLQDRGLSGTQVLLAIASLCLATGASVVLSAALGTSWIALGTAATLLLFLVAGRVFGYQETSLLLRHLQSIGTLMAAAPRTVRSVSLIERMRDCSMPFDSWRALTAHAGSHQVLELEFVYCAQCAEEAVARLRWSADPAGKQSVSLRQEADRPSHWELRCSVLTEAGSLALAIARGQQRANRSARGLDELTRVLQAFCLRWSTLSEAQVADPLPSTQAPAPADAASEPRDILPLPAATTGRRAA